MNLPRQSRHPIDFRIDLRKVRLPARAGYARTTGGCRWTWTAASSGTINWSDASADVEFYSWQLDDGA